MMKKATGIIAALLIVISLPAAAAAHIGPDGCCNGIRLAGKVRIVSHGGDLKVKTVDAFPDLNVKAVSAFPHRLGEWQFVSSGENFTIQFVDYFPDLTIRFVTAFPGLPH